MACCISAKNNRILKSKPVLEFFTISFIKGPKEQVKTEKNLKLVDRIIGATHGSVPPLKKLRGAAAVAP